MTTSINVPRTNSTISFTPAQRATNNATLRFQDMTEIITADLEVSTFADGVEYALLNPRIYDPTSKSYKPLTDQDLRVSAKNFDLAKEIFWPRYRNFVRRLTGKNIHTEITRILRLDHTCDVSVTNREQPDQVNAATNSKRLTKKELELAQTPA